MTWSSIMASFSSLLQEFFTCLQRCNQMESSLSTWKESFGNLFLRRRKGGRFWNHIFFKAPLLGSGGVRNDTDFTVPKSQIVARLLCAEMCVYLRVCTCECEYMYMCTYGHTHLHICIKCICTYIYMYETRMELPV